MEPLLLNIKRDMPMPFFLDQTESLIADETLLGGKAKNLAWLKRFGFNVPAFIVVTTEAFHHYLEIATGRSYGDLMTALRLDPLAEASRIHAAILATSLPESLLLPLRDKLKSLPEGFLAIRSSVVGEDSQEASFAGQMETFLFMKTFEEIAQAVVQCFASAFADRAILYRTDRGLALESISAAVVCQIMIDSDVSGVLFTAHPNTGIRTHHLISAAWGLGEGIVSGECNTDEFVLAYENNAASIIERKLTDKDHAVRFDATRGRGTVTLEVERTLRMQACLSDEQIFELSRLSYAIALHQGSPQDLEFAIKDGVVFLLQTRPITSLPPALARDAVVWDNSNIQESYCGVTTPLTFSFASRTYRNVYENTAEVLGYSLQGKDGMDVVLRNLLGLIQGRVYYNINNWYQGLSAFPSFGSNKEDMERMMGLQDPVDFVVKTQLSGWQGLKAKFKAIRTLLGLLSRFARIKTQVEAFRVNFAEAYRTVDKQSLFLRDLSDLYRLTRTLESDVIKRWTTPIVNDFYVMMMNGKVHRKLKKLGIENPSLTLNNLLSGEAGIESTEPTKFLLGMCDRIRADARLLPLFASTPNSALMTAIQVNCPDFHKQCLQYIELYGDRTMGELKLESITLHQDTTFMFVCLRNFLQNDTLNLASLQRHELDLRHAEEKRIFKALKGPLAVLMLKRDLKRLRNAVKNRENMRLARTRLFGLYRAIYIEMGKQLALHKQLKDPRDIFYLTVEEIEQYFEGRAVGIKFHDLAQLRKSEFDGFEAHEPAHHFKTFGSPYLGNSFQYTGTLASASDGETLQGLGCYPGIVEGRVRLIFSPDDEISLQGQILCTVRTDPGWAPLFPSAAGIIVERGSSLSHSAVVARELGIPAIVNIPGLTKILKDGERIRMNGQTGLIERLDR